jgi:hypothetical protein
LVKRAQAEAYATKRARKQKRPGKAEAHYSTEILYHEGNEGQIKELGAKERRVKSPTLA